MIGALIAACLPYRAARALALVVALAASAGSAALGLAYLNAGMPENCTFSLVSYSSTLLGGAGHTVEIFGVLIDRVSTLICFAVVFLGFLVVLYSTAYLTKGNREHPHEGTTRFYAIMLAFIGAMAGLTLSSTLFGQLLFFEITGGCSWGLIGYYQTPKALRSGMKALLVTHLGALGLYVAAAWLYHETGSFALSGMAGLGDTAKIIIVGGVLFAAWGKSGNIAGRPGYVKMGAGSAAASLYTPELTALPDAATVKVRFSAQAYSEKYDGSGADAGKILVKAVRGAVLGAKGAITGTVTEVSAADPVDISAAKARFREFEATLTNVTPDCRIVISTSEKRALLDNVVVTCTAITPATKPAAPGGVSFDAAAAADRLTLKWNAVPDATSYTVAYWKGSASAPESEYAYKTGIASTATSQELTNLESNTSYWAKVKAVGSLDSDWSETANATTMDSGGEPLLPTADLLDVVFRNDGSAMDNSSSATPVRRMPSSRP